MRSTVGPSRTRRPRNANGSRRKGWTRSSDGGWVSLGNFTKTPLQRLAIRLLTRLVAALGNPLPASDEGEGTCAVAGRGGKGHRTTRTAESRSGTATAFHQGTRRECPSV